MNTQTPQNRVLFASTLRHPVFRVFAIVLTLVTVVTASPVSPQGLWRHVLPAQPVATAATVGTINFQARLQNAAGAIAPDGTYNVEFNLYSLSSGGSSLWTEDYLNSAANGVTVKNGYLTVNLGSTTAFPSTINWDQDLYLGMTVRGTASCTFASCTPTDAEMTPRLKLTASAYAFKANQLAQYDSSSTFTSSLKLAATTTGGNQVFQIQDAGAAGTYTLLTSANGIQLQGSTPGTAQTGNFNISGTGIAGTLQAASFDTASGVGLNIGASNATSVTIAKTGVATTIADSLQVNSTISATGTINTTGAYNLSGSNFASVAGNYNAIRSRNGAGGVRIYDSSATYALLQVTDSGATSFQNSSDSTAALTVKDAAGTSTILQVNTTGGYVGIDNVSPQAPLDVGLGKAGTFTDGFESGSISPFVGSGNKPWSTITSTANSGTFSAVSGAIGDSQTSTMSLTNTLSAGGTISFAYSTSTESSDRMYFYIDGVQKAVWGTSVTPWTPTSFPLTGGTHTYTWSYVKDSSGSLGADQVYIDDVQITNVAASSTSALFAGNVGIGGGSPAYALDVTGTIRASSSLLGPSFDTATAAMLGIGTTTANAVSISKSGVTTTVNGALAVTQATTLSGNLTVTNAGSVAFQQGANFTTTGQSNDVNFGTGVLFRLTGASAQTITGIAGGTNGRMITLVNAGASTAIIADAAGALGANSLAANRISTGTAANINLASGASISLVYDSTSSLWRVVGATASSSGGTYITLQGGTPGTADTGNFNISGTGIANTLQGTTSLKTPLLDSISGTLSVGTSTATAVSIGKSGATTTVNGALSITQDASFGANLNITSGNVVFGGDSAHSLSVGAASSGAGNTLTISGGNATLPSGITVVGQSITYINSTTGVSVTHPAGMQVGDLMVLTVGHYYSTTATPAGWTLLDSKVGMNTNGEIYTKTVTAGDIGGSTLLGFGGSGYGDAIIVAYHNVAAIHAYTTMQSQGGPAVQSLGPIAVTSGDLVMSVGQARQGGGGPLSLSTGPTINSDSSANATAILGYYTAASTGTTSQTFSGGWSGGFYYGLLTLTPVSGGVDGGNLMLAGGLGAGTGNNGSVIVKNSVNSTNAFQVQNSSGTALTTADTTNMAFNVNGVTNLLGQTNLSTDLQFAADIPHTVSAATASNGTGSTITLSGGNASTISTLVVGQKLTYINGASSATTTYPSGIRIGDMLVLAVGQDYGPTGAPSGWTLLDNSPGAFDGGGLYYKFATSSDIGGSVTVNFGGVGGGHLMVTAVRNVSGVRSYVAGRNSFVPASETMGPISVTNGDYVLYAGQGRASGDTLSISSGTTLAQDSQSGSAAVVGYSVAASTGSLSQTFNNTVTPSGRYYSVLALIPTSTANGGNIVLGGGTAASGGVAGGVIVKNSTNSTTAFQIQNATGTSLFTADTSGMGITVGGALSITGNLTVTNAGNIAFQKGADYSTVGSQNNVNFGTGALFRLTGASAQTITGIAGGADGRRITLINAGTNGAILKNSSGLSSAGNQIVTGTGSDFTIPAGSSISLVYDAGTSPNVWRVIAASSGGGGGSYITLQGSTPGTADTGNLNISGTGIFGTAIQGPSLDTASAGTLSLGTGTNSSAVSISKSGATTTVNGALTVTQAATFNGNVTLGATKTLTLTGDTTANRPASPTEGMLYYDTTTKKLIIYSNGKWQASSQSAILVAANNSSQADKDAADYVATGSGDQATINSALAAADPAGSGRKTGKVILLAGTYLTSDPISIPNNTTLAGEGPGTFIKFSNLSGASKDMITNATTGGSGYNVVIRDIALDGSKSANTTGTVNGINLNGLGFGSGLGYRPGAQINNVVIDNFHSVGITMSGTYNTTVSGVTVKNSNYGLLTSSVSDLTITGSAFLGNTNAGVETTNTTSTTISGSTFDGNGSEGGVALFSNTTGSTVTGNGFVNNSVGIYAGPSSAHNTITGNTVESSSNAGIELESTVNNSVTGNTITASASAGGIYLTNSANTNNISGNKLFDNGGATTNNAIKLTSSDSNSITDNNITDSSATTNNYAINIVNSTSDTNYLADNLLGGGSINDLGTGTIYASQQNTSGYFAFQGSSATRLGIGTTAPAEMLNVYNGNIQVDYGNYKANTVIAPGAPTVAVNATAGNLTGPLYYVVTFVTATGETNYGTVSSSVNPTAQQVNITAIPTGASGVVTGRKIYRGTGSNGPYQLVTTIADNTTTAYTDNIAAGSLGATATTTNTTGGLFVVNGNNLINISPDSSVKNTFVGLQSGVSTTTGTSNTAVGYFSLKANTTGKNNTANGSGALGGNTTGTQNTAIGANALQVSNSGDNTAVGFSALVNLAGGFQNTGVGSSALRSVTSGNNNTALGYNAGFSDFNSKFSTLSGTLNSTAIGAFAQVQANNSIVLGSVDTPTKIGIGTTVPLNSFSVSPLDYQTGTATRTNSSAALVGTGTTWTNAMVGDLIVFADGTTNTVTGWTDATHITMGTTYAGTTDASPVYYRFHKVGLQVTSAGKIGLGNTSPAYALDVTGQINSTTGFLFNGAAGTTTTCNGATPSLSNVTIQGGIITGVTCAASGGGGGSYVTLQAGSPPGTADTGNLNISGTGIFATALQAPSLDTASAGTLNLGTGTNSSAVSISKSGATTTVNGALNVLQAATFNGSGFDGTGNLGIGTTSPGRPLQVSTNNSTVNAQQLLIKQNGSGDAGLELQNGTSSYYVGVDSSNASRFTINSSVAASAGTTTNSGFTSPSGSFDFGNNGSLTVSKVTAGATGTVSTISVYIHAVDASNPHMQVALYADDTTTTGCTVNSCPGGVAIAHTGSQTLTPNSWNSFSISASVTNGTSYWIAFNVDGAATQYNTNGPGRASFMAAVTYGDWTRTYSQTGSGATPYTVYMTINSGANTDNNANPILSLGGTGDLQLRNVADSTSAFAIQNAAGTNLLTADTSNKLITVNGGLTVTNAGNIAFQKGADYSTVGSQNNVNFGTGALFRLTGASAQTITGIAGGADGRRITLINAGTNGAILKNSSGLSSAGNQIVTGTGSDFTIPAGSSISLVYDAGTSPNVWRVIAASSGGGGGGVSSLNTQTGSLTLQGTANQIVVTNGSGTITLSTPQDINTTSGVTFGSLTVGASGNTVVLTNNFSTNGRFYSGNARPTRTIKLTPEFPSAVFSAISGSGANVGYMNSDYDSTNHHNYYRWTTDQASAQDYDIIVQYQLPSDFDGMVASSVKSQYFVTNTSTNSVKFQMLDASGTSCGAMSTISSTSNAWSQSSGMTPSGCTLSADDVITLDFRMSATTATTNLTQLGTFQLQYYSKF